MSQDGTTLVHTADATTVGARGSRELERETLSENVRNYMAQIEGIVGRAPEDVGGLKLTDFGASAEISIHHPVSDEFLESAVSQRHAHT